MALKEGIAQAAIWALGKGQGFPYVGNNEGEIDFWYAPDGSHYEDTVLFSGATGLTRYMQVYAAHTAPLATTVVALYLYGTSGGRDTLTRKLFAQYSPISQALNAADEYVVTWILRSEINS